MVLTLRLSSVEPKRYGIAGPLGADCTSTKDHRMSSLSTAPMIFACDSHGPGCGCPARDGSPSQASGGMIRSSRGLAATALSSVTSAAASGQSRVAQGHAPASVGDVAGAAAGLAQAAEPEARREAAGWYLALGEFSRASALLAGLDAETLSGEMNAVASAHLLAGDLPRAAETLRAWARRLDRAHPSQSLLRQLRALHCLAGLLERHAARAPREAGFDAEGRCVMGYDPAVHAEAERTLAAEERVRMRARLEVGALERPRPPAEDADLDAWMDRVRVPHDPALRQWLRARNKVAVVRWLRTRAPTPRSALAISAAAQRLGALDPVDLQSLVETELPWRVPFEPFATAALGREVAALLHAQGHRTALAEHAARVARLERAVSDDVVLLAWRLVARY